jgi:hypothetical protein
MKSLFCGQGGDIFCRAIAFLLQHLERLGTYFRRDRVGPCDYSRRMVHSDCLGIYRRR